MFWKKLTLQNFYILTLLSTMLVIVGCGNSSSSQEGKPLDPEELGYYQEFNTIWTDTVNSTRKLLEAYALSVNSKKTSNIEREEEQNKIINKEYAKLKNISKEELSTLNSVLPPASMKNFHSEWLGFLQNISNQQSPQDITDSGERFLKAHSIFKGEFEDRPKELSENGGFAIEFKPYGLPLAISRDIKSGEFNLEITTGVTTPAGEFTVKKPPEDLPRNTKLKIIHGEKVRYVVLAPGFKGVYIPPNCGAWMNAAEKGSGIIVTVSDCNAQSQVGSKSQVEDELEIPSQKDTDLNTRVQSEPTNPSHTSASKSSQEEQNQTEQQITKNSPHSSEKTSATWRSQSNLTRIENLDQICWGTSHISSVQTIFGKNQQPLTGKIIFPSPKTGGCMPGDTLKGNFELSGNIDNNCVGTIKITWQNDNNASIEWNISNLGSACPVGKNNWKINTYPVKP
jgi:hypothetical protein